MNFRAMFRLDPEPGELGDRRNGHRSRQAMMLVVAALLLAQSPRQTQGQNPSPEDKPVNNDRVLRVDVLQACRLDLVGMNGKTGAVFATNTEEKWPMLFLYDQNGIGRLGFHLNEYGSPIVTLNDARQEQRLCLWSSLRNSAAIESFSSEGRLQLALSSGTEPNLRLCVPGSTRGTEFSVKESGPAILMNQGGENAPARIKLGEDSLTMEMVDSSGKVVFKAP